MNALADAAVGEFLNEHFVSAFQKVATFQIVNGQKQGGNVASYFCAADGRVLHVVAGPVDAATLLREAQWVVKTVKESLAAYHQDGTSFKAQIRVAHAQRLRQEFGLAAEAVPFDAPAADDDSALSYRDPAGAPLAPVLESAPVEGPDVSFTPEQKLAFRRLQAAAGDVAGVLLVDELVCRCGPALSNQARVHMLLAAHSLRDIETLYGSIFQGILGEQISTRPVEVVTPFPWYGRR